MKTHWITAALLSVSAHAFAQTTRPTTPDAVAKTEEAAAGAGTRSPIAAGGNSAGFDMAPETNEAVVKASVAAIPVQLPAGPGKPDWDSLKSHYEVPAWFTDAKFGIFMHWGLYSVPAYRSEWYMKHMYAALSDYHVKTFGPQDKFGYKDFIPMFTAAEFDPNAWAELFKKSGAKFVVPTAQHHDGFALWASDGAAPWNAGVMGPKRDLIGELAKSVRAQGLKFGVSNHGIENFTFINPKKDVAEKLRAAQADLYDPKYQDFYHVMDRSDAACQKFLVNWAMRNVELIEKYQPDMIWFDNGVDQRFLDPLKLWFASYYYNRAADWGKQVTISTKKAAYAPSNDNTQTIGSIIDFEKIGARSPSEIRTGAWVVDDPIGSTWGYTEGMRIAGAQTVVSKLIDTISKNGTYLLNLSPKPDGTIPQAQQDTLLEVGKWLEVNGEGVYGTHSWIKSAEGGGRESPAPRIHFTAKDKTVYAHVLGNYPTGPVTITSITPAVTAGATISDVSLLGSKSPVAFEQSPQGLVVTLPAEAPCKYAYVLKIEGLAPAPSPITRDGNPTPEQLRSLAK